MPDMPQQYKPMGTWDINLDKQTATSINGITFKLTETKPGNISNPNKFVYLKRGNEVEKNFPSKSIKGVEVISCLGFSCLKFPPSKKIPQNYDKSES